MTANWTVLDPLVYSSDNPATTLTELGYGSLLASGAKEEGLLETYTVRARTPIQGITGVRLETMADSSLSHDGPGRAEKNGNFVIREFSLDATATPEPSAFALVMCAGLALLGRRRRDRSNG